MRLHDERWWKCGWYQTLCMNNIQPWALKPSHTMKACVLSNHVKFRRILEQVEGISLLDPFTAQRMTSANDGISDGLVIGRHYMTFQESFDKDSIDWNGEWWHWDFMMNVDENVEDLKDYVRMTCILEPWNPPTMWRHVSYLTMSNFNAYRHKLKEFQHWPHSLLNMRLWWIMVLVMGLLEDVPWHF